MCNTCHVCYCVFSQQTVDHCPAWHNTSNTSNTSGPSTPYMYLGQLGGSMPDLNLRSDKVKDELQEILKFWSVCYTIL